MEVLVLDNFDSFTYNLVDYLEQCGVSCVVVRNNASIEEIKKNQFHAIVISPGPEKPVNAGSLMEVLDYYHTMMPILGICLGHQAIGQYFGGSLNKAQEPRHGKINSITLKNNTALFDGLPEKINVVQYNSLIVSDVPNSQLEVIAEDKDGLIMGIKHKTLPIFGVQFHPEAALTQYGIQIIKNWTDLVRLDS